MRNIILPVDGLMIFPKAGTFIDPSTRPGRTLIRYQDEEIGRQPFILPVFEKGVALQLYTRMEKGKRGVLLTAEITGANDHIDSLRKDWENDRSLRPWPFSDWVPAVEENSSVEINGFLNYDATEDPKELFIGNIKHSFGYLGLHTRGVSAHPLFEIFGCSLDECILRFSMRKRSYENLSALCRVGKAMKIDNGKDTVFWGPKNKRSVKITNPN